MSQVKNITAKTDSKVYPWATDCAYNKAYECLENEPEFQVVEKVQRFFGRMDELKDVRGKNI
jgi:hypothetical protein